MSQLHLIRVPLDLDKLARWARERGWARRRGRTVVYDEGRALHHLLDETLGVGVLRPFRLLVAPRQRTGNLYAYSKSDADELRRTSNIQALPDHLSVLQPNDLESKVMPEDWSEGQRLGFDVRVRPIRRLKRELVVESEHYKKGREVDAYFLEATRKHPEDLNGMSSSNRTREDVYVEWLAERLASVAEVEQSSSRLVRFERSFTARGKHVSEGPDAVLHGTLKVLDPAGFAAALANGVGRHKAFGYGMILLRSPNKPVPNR